MTQRFARAVPQAPGVLGLQLAALGVEPALRHAVGRVLEVDPLRPARKEWKEIVPERTDATLVSASVLGGRLARQEFEPVARDHLHLRGRGTHLYGTLGLAGEHHLASTRSEPPCGEHECPCIGAPPYTGSTDRRTPLEYL